MKPSIIWSFGFFLSWGLEREKQLQKPSKSCWVGFIFGKRQQQECSQVFTEGNLKENSSQTHWGCFKQLDFLAAPVKSKQGKWLSLFFLLCFARFLLARLDGTKHILCAKVSQAADEIKFPVIIWGVSQLRVSTCGGLSLLMQTYRGEKRGSGVH